MRTKRQPDLNLGEQFKPRLEHGGSLGRGKRKLMRPFDPKRPVHLTMRAGCARGKLSMLRIDTEKRIKKLETQVSARWKIHVIRSANSGNHLHLLVKAPTHEAWKGFLREFAGRVARLVTGAKKGKPFGRKFWDALAHTRVVDWGRAFFHAKFYVIQNELEAAGVWRRKWSSKRPPRAGARPRNRVWDSPTP